MVDWIKVIFKPKSILGLLVVSGVVFLFAGGVTMQMKDISDFFTKWGQIFLIIGLVGWLFFIIPAIINLWSKIK